MAILSYEFALCFTVFFIVYWACYRRPQVQNILLILASIGFILTWQWLFLASMVFVWLVLQACTYGFTQTTSNNAKKWILFGGLTALIGHLCFFKYSNFVIEQLNVAVLSDASSLTPLDIIMPLGVSFYTFQGISYLVDVYQKKMAPMPSAILFGFLSFIPTLTAGPIFRAKAAQKQWLLQSDDALADSQNSTAVALNAKQTPQMQTEADSQSAPLKTPKSRPASSHSARQTAKLHKKTLSDPMGDETYENEADGVTRPTITYRVNNGDDPSYWRQSKQQSPLYYRIDISAGLQVGDNIPIVDSSDVRSSLIDAPVEDSPRHQHGKQVINVPASELAPIKNSAMVNGSVIKNDNKDADNQAYRRASANTAVGNQQLSPKASANNGLHRRRYILMPYLALALIAIALFKKLVLASWLESIWVTPVFANPMQFHGLEVLTAIYAYALQLFFDFSGYTDLVVAIALLLGFRLPENFRQPYLATDIQDFWKKWHITLSTWIKDYLYIPLGGGRRSFLRVQVNIMLAFVISGVWHGAGWNFFVWGAIHGIALVFLNVLKRLKLRFWLTKHVKPLAIFLTFHYVCFGWIFFHSITFHQAMQMITALGNYGTILFSLPVVPTLVMMAMAWIIYPYLSHAREQIARLLAILPWWLLPIPIALYVVLLFNLAPDGLPGFIYANF